MTHDGMTRINSNANTNSEKKSKIKVLAVAGPTASGKTAHAIALALRLGGEVISCDSMQVYRGMDIGTAKPTPGETRGIPHHMIDIADIGDTLSCADYAARASEIARQVFSRGKLPVFCGGTGLYLDAVLTGNVFADMKTPRGLREELEALPPDELYSRLEAVDPESAAAVHPNNVRRVIRALEIYLTTGETKSALDARSRTGGSDFAPVIFGLDFPDRAMLYERIDRRVDLMLEAGLEAEVRRLAPRLREAPTAAQAIGYKEMLRHIDCTDGSYTLENAADDIKQATRRYAKRQLTWFRRNPDMVWLDASALNGAAGDEVCADAARRLAEIG